MLRPTDACLDWTNWQLPQIPAQQYGPDSAPLTPNSSFVDFADRGGFVVLRAHGGTASVVFERETTVGYTRSYCSPKVMNGVTIKFASPATFFVSIPPAKVCTGTATTNVGGVVSGVTSWL